MCGRTKHNKRNLLCYRLLYSCKNSTTTKCSLDKLPILPFVPQVQNYNSEDHTTICPITQSFLRSCEGSLNYYKLLCTLPAFRSLFSSFFCLDSKGCLCLLLALDEGQGGVEGERGRDSKRPFIFLPPPFSPQLCPPQRCKRERPRRMAERATVTKLR